MGKIVRRLPRCGVREGLRAKFDAVMAKKNRNTADAEAGQAFTSGYVDYIHCVERLYDAAGAAGTHQAGAEHAH